MKILFIHQNFPGQFKFLAPALAGRGHHVTALSTKEKKACIRQGVRIIPYGIARGSSRDVHPWLSDFETKVIRGQACFQAAKQMAASGYSPDLIISHPGWGESLFLKELWPAARLRIYCEFYYHAEGTDVGFDPEFPSSGPEAFCRLKMKNLNNLVHMEMAEAGLSPTRWQASTFPQPFRSKISVIHDGIDTRILKPSHEARLTLTTSGGSSVALSRNDEVITFVNRNLEPYRGYHTFMRSLPGILERRKEARILIVGGDDVSYGAKPPAGLTWKTKYIREVRPRISDSDWQRVHFLGQIPYREFIRLLQISSVHVYLTYPFVLSWSLLEAMACGCAIVASDTAPLQEVIDPGHNGLLFDFFDPASLTEHVANLADNKKLQERLGRNARQFAVEHYDLMSVTLPQQIEWVEYADT